MNLPKRGRVVRHSVTLCTELPTHTQVGGEGEDGNKIVSLLKGRDRKLAVFN